MVHDAGLLDELRAQAAPVTFGAGTPLLPRRTEGLQVHEVHPNGQFVEITHRV